MASVNDCLVQLQKLTQQNLEILQAINDSFLSNQNHLSVKVGETSYAIPSFISLENKINNLQDNFENLINAPKTGEAYFNLDGNSRAIEVRSYTHTPNSLKLTAPTNFGVQENDIFKDFLTPTPYVNFKLTDLPNDITSVNVKKVIPKSAALLGEFVGRLGDSASVKMSWADLYKILSLYKENEDYIEYDSVRKLPIRKNIGSGTYVIEKIVSDTIDENLDEYIVLKLRTDVTSYSNKLSYKLFDETIEKLLQVGDQLITFDDSAKMEITEISHNTNTIQVKVLNGEYLNLVADMESEENHINDLAKIKFYSPVDFDADKYVNIPLEEDQYIFIAIAPLNDRMNIQSPWGVGVIINTYNLYYNKDGFEDYYKKNVRNIGDILYELTAMSSGSLSKLSREDFNELTNTPAEMSSDNLKVVQINTHLNDSMTVKNIRSLYSQKKRYNTELSETQTKIDDINAKLASVSFDDTSNLRTVYTAQLTEYNKTKNELIASLTKIIDEISIAANNSDIPIENAKYHIRGFYKLSENDSNVRGIKVQYRYKNLDNTYGKATTINEDFLFSDWNEVNSYRPKVASLDNTGYVFDLQENTDTQNVPSFNQIDIPISQGETVDIRIKKIYDYGYPYVEITSGWSEVINIEFPKEYLKDVQILDIISENNSDIETNRFENILREAGIPEHIGDKIQDQDITYFHKPENIASGFYTSERRIVPLKDKLSELSNLLIQLQDEVLGTSAESLDVSIGLGDISNNILPDQDNYMYVEEYNNFDTSNSNISGPYVINDDGLVSVVANLTLTNNSNHTLKLYPIFPGSRDVLINDLYSRKYNIDDYIIPNSTLLSYEKNGRNIATIRKNYNGYALYHEGSWYDIKVEEEIDNNGNITGNENIILLANNFNMYDGDPNVNYFVILSEKYNYKIVIESSPETYVIDDSRTLYSFNPSNGVTLLYDSNQLEYLEEAMEVVNDNSKAYFKEIYAIKRRDANGDLKYVTKSGPQGTYAHLKLCAYILTGEDDLKFGWVYDNWSTEDDDQLYELGMPETPIGYYYKNNMIIPINDIDYYLGYSPIGEVLDITEIKYYVGGRLVANVNSSSKCGVWVYNNSTNTSKLQTANQFITFRTNNAFTGAPYYDIIQNYDTDNMISGYSDYFKGVNPQGATIYPALSDEYGLCIDSSSGYSYELIPPSSSIIIPLIFEYKLDKTLTSIQKTMSFDLRPSLYKEPINYTFTIIAKKDATIQDTVLNTNRKYINDIKYSTTVVK